MEGRERARWSRHAEGLASLETYTSFLGPSQTVLSREPRVCFISLPSVLPRCSILLPRELDTCRPSPEADLSFTDSMFQAGSINSNVLPDRAHGVSLTS